jgi:hypothetical protein
MAAAVPRLAVLFVCAALSAARAAGQGLPPEPLSAAGGRVAVGVDVSATIAPEDPGFFNYSSYEHNLLREFRVGVAAQVRASSRLALLAEIRSENLDDLRAFALYARYRPLMRARLDVQAGRIPPTFGRASRTTYDRDNPLIGLPLAYQYLTSLRADALPTDADALLGMRGRGWLVQYPLGDQDSRPGLPLASALRWDTGVQVTGGWRGLTAAGAVTVGSLSNPRVRDDNGGKGLATRITFPAAPGLEVGASYARGAFVSRAALRAAGQEDSGEYVQTGYGLDAEYARGHLTVTAEAVGSEWRIPLGGTTRALRALAGSVGVRYAVLPGVHVAGRLEHLAFSRLRGSAGARAWDAPVTRLELGGGYRLHRNLLARVAWQFNDRDAGRVRRDRLLAAQLLFWL